jgi:hypothetical protein
MPPQPGAVFLLERDTIFLIYSLERNAYNRGSRPDPEISGWQVFYVPFRLMTGEERDFSAGS